MKIKYFVPIAFGLGLAQEELPRDLNVQDIPRSDTQSVLVPVLDSVPKSVTPMDQSVQKPTSKSLFSWSFEVYEQFGASATASVWSIENRRSKVEFESKYKLGPVRFDGTLQADFGAWGSGIWDEAWFGLGVKHLWASWGLQKSPIGLDSRLGSRSLWFYDRSMLAEHLRKDLDVSGYLPMFRLATEWGKELKWKSDLVLAQYEHFENGTRTDQYQALPAWSAEIKYAQSILRYQASGPQMAYVVNAMGEHRSQRYLLQELWLESGAKYWEVRAGAYWADPNMDTLAARLYWNDRSFMTHDILLQARALWGNFALAAGYENAVWEARDSRDQWNASLAWKWEKHLEVLLGQSFSVGEASPFLQMTLSFALPNKIKTAPK